MKIGNPFVFVAALTVMILAGTSCYPGEDIDWGQESKPDPEDPEYTYSTAFTPGESGYAFFRIPAMVVCNDASILAFAEGRVNSVEDTGDIDIVVKRSTDRGKTWGKLIVVKNDGENRCHNPVPVVLESGRVLLLYCWNLGAETPERTVYTIFSDDNGQTWGKETDITPQIQLPGEYRYATGPVHGIVKNFAPNKGRIIIPARCAPVVNKPAHIIYSDDQGVTWRKGGVADFPNGNECTVAELGNGDLILNMRNTNTSNFYRYDATSKDGGVSFLPSRQTTLIEPITGCQGSLLRYKVDEATGKTVLLFSNPNHVSSRRFGTIKASYDDGNTWTKMYQYVPSTGDNLYTSYSDIALIGGVDDIAVLYESGYKNSLGILFRTVKFSDIKDPIPAN